jgi:hypothetical protein
MSCTVKAADKLGEIRCRFDYVKLADGSLQPGQLVGLHADGCLTHSSYSTAEASAKPDDPLPTPAELDYALLRLDTSVGEQQVEGKKRGWIGLPTQPFPLPENAPLLIMQHPEGQPMKLALDTQSVIARNSNGTRVRYHTNTERGSSGSPCFTMDWDIVALHHYGDPAWQRPLFNQGVPIELIRNRIVAQGFGVALGT